MHPYTHARTQNTKKTNTQGNILPDEALSLAHSIQETLRFQRVLPKAERGSVGHCDFVYMYVIGCHGEKQTTTAQYNTIHNPTQHHTTAPHHATAPDAAVHARAAAAAGGAEPGQQERGRRADLPDWSAGPTDQGDVCFYVFFLGSPARGRWLVGGSGEGNVG